MRSRHNTPKFRRKKKSHPILAVLALAVILPALALSAFFVKFDINSYREALAQVIHEQTGREINLDGEIAWNFSLHQGISLIIKDIVIKNPSWASRPDMARIGQAKLHLETMPLVEKKINITAIDLSKMDVQLETAKNGDVNWAFSPKKNEDAKDIKSPKPETSPQTRDIAIHVQGLSVAESRCGIKKADGSLSIYEVPELSLINSAKGLRAYYKGTIQGLTTEIDISGGNAEKVMKEKWPFSLIAMIDGKKIETQGSVREGFKKIVLDKLLLSANETHIAGNMTLSFAGTRPKLEGAVTGDYLDFDDLSFSIASTAQASSPTEEQTAKQPSGKIFSKEPLPLDALKAFDANLGLNVKTLALGLTTMQQVKTDLVLEGGRLTMAPITGSVAGGATTISIKVDASSPNVQMATMLKAPSLDLSQLFKLWGMESAISGKTAIDIDLTSTGQSTHELAAHTNGKINLLMDTGSVSSTKLGEIAGTLMQIFAPGVSALSNPGVNCLAARYIVTDGLVDTKGLIIDTEVTTISGKGYINLPDERIGMSLFTRPKGIGIGSMFPPMKISGALSSPSFDIDTASAAQKLAGLVTNNGTDAHGVPNLVEVPGKNACALAIDNPNLPKASSSAPLLPSSVGGVTGKIQEIGEELIKGFLSE